MSSVLGFSLSLLSRLDSESFVVTTSKSDFVILDVATSGVTLAEAFFLEVT